MVGNPRQATATQPRPRRVRGRYLILVFFILIGLVVFLESPLTRVRTLHVSGNLSIPANRILADARILPGLNLWQVSERVVRFNVMSREPLVDSVVVYKDYLRGTVTVAITQKNIVAVYVHRGQYVRLLSDGTAYDTTTATQGFRWPIVTDNTADPVKLGQPVANADVTVLCRMLNGMPERDLTDVSELHVSNFGVVTLYLDNRFEAECQITDLKKILPDVFVAAQYFVNKRYSPGLIDMTGTPPYRYTPFVITTAPSAKGTSKP